MHFKWFKLVLNGFHLVLSWFKQIWIFKKKLFFGPDMVTCVQKWNVGYWWSRRIWNWPDHKQDHGRMTTFGESAMNCWLQLIWRPACNQFLGIFSRRFSRINSNSNGQGWDTLIDFTCWWRVFSLQKKKNILKL